MKKVYLDNAATTAVKPEVMEAMLPYFTEYFGNPSSPHSFGREAQKGITHARKQVQAAIGAAREDEIIFTGGGTEGDNMVLRGITSAYKSKGCHVITTNIEHHAVLHTCEALEKSGIRVTYLPADEYGMVTAEQVKEAIADDTILVSIMFANNEVGTIMPIAEIGAVCKEAGVLFHTDAVQAIGHVPIDVIKMNIDMLSLSAHKFHGPKGIGAVYVKKGIRLPGFILGGGQERSLRAGTHNTPAIVGMGKAIEMAIANIDNEILRTTALRDKLLKGIAQTVPHIKLNGHPTERLPGNVNYSIRYVEGEGLLLMLDMNGIAASSGSACTSGSLDPSHVLLAMGLSHEVAHGSLRLTIGDLTTEDDIDYVLEKLPGAVQKLRDISPLYPGNGE